MATSYENIPVFQTGTQYDSPDDIIGRAQVQIDEASGKSVITIEGGEKITEFLTLGTLRSFGINAMIHDVDPEKIKEYWSRQQ